VKLFIKNSYNFLLTDQYCLPREINSSIDTVVKVFLTTFAFVTDQIISLFHSGHVGSKLVETLS